MAIKRTKKEEVEYEDAPSGYVTFYNYKEPLMKFEGGYGYVGALLFDGESDKIQCHLCGEWYGSLPPHLIKEHAMRAPEYREIVGLLKNTALISESSREKLIASGLDKRLQNLRNRKGMKHTPEQRARISATLKANNAKSEGMNLRGTCPAQLIDRMQTIYKQNGETFRIHDFNYFEALLRKTFGSVKEACHIAGIPYSPPGKNYSYDHLRKTKRHDAVKFVAEFLQKNRKSPTWSDFKKSGNETMYNSHIRNKEGLREIVREAHLATDLYVKSDIRVRYTDSDLLEFMRKFEKYNGRKPSYSDAKRGLLPTLSNYSRRFGSWKNALEIAFN